MSDTLTAWETQAMNSHELNLADGHAYHELPAALSGVVDRLPELWHRAAGSSLATVEGDFRTAWCRVTGTPSLVDAGEMRLCPTASNSLDIVAAWCRSRRLRVAIVEPTFDNLALLFRRREVPLVPVDSTALADAAAAGSLSDLLDGSQIGALLLVNPNNPTGQDLGREAFVDVARWCSSNDVVLIMDNTFRHFRRDAYDDGAVLLESGCRFISVEDTGKTWPTLDAKVSALFFSSEIGELHEFYEEQYLCSSGATVVMMTEMLDITADTGLGPVVWDLVDQRRQRLRQVLRDGAISIAPESLGSAMPVEWLDCSRLGDSRAAATRLREDLGIHLLPGDAFFWARGKERLDRLPHERTRLRLSLSKPESVFAGALDALAPDRIARTAGTPLTTRGSESCHE